MKRVAPVPGDVVLLRRPAALRGALALVQRELPDGWEVEVRTAAGTPQHLTVSPRDLERVVAAANPEEYPALVEPGRASR